MLNRIKRLKDKGVIVVWLALFLLFLLLAMAGMAVDGSYLYFAKNQLQVAADSAVLAGVGAGLSGSDNSTSALAQTDARRAAWKFACKNTADQFNPDPGGLNNHVYLVSDFGLRSVTESNFMDTTCDNAASSLTAAQLNGTSNDPNGDIVVGYWTLPSAPSGAICERVGAGFFCPATGSTNLPINAVKAVARRTGDAAVPNVKFGGNHVRLFLGQIMRLIGANWSFMNVTASAIAGPGQVLTTPALSLCVRSCSVALPRLFDIQSNLTCGATYGAAWTTFESVSPIPNNDIQDLIDGTRTLTAQDVKNLCNNKCVTTKNGVDSINYLGQKFRDTAFDASDKDIVGGVVTAWRVAIVITNYHCCPDTGCESCCPSPVTCTGPTSKQCTCGPDDCCQGCPPSAQGGTSEPYHVQRWAKVTISKVCDNTNGSDPECTKKGVVISSLTCEDCSGNPLDTISSGKPSLVK
jgi:Flp pilus assembly protein TadG